MIPLHALPAAPSARPPRPAAALTLASAAVPQASVAALDFAGLAAARLRGFQPASVVTPVPRPVPRPDSLSRRIEAGFFGFGKRKPNYSVTGSVCGNPAIRGIATDPIVGPSGCGISHPVKVTEVAGVTLSTGALMDCNTARALLTWVEDVAIPAVGKTGGGLKGLKVAAHYACRPRNNKRGAKISEHGKGRAIDLSALYLDKGSITVLTDWGRGNKGRILSRLHEGACGPFGTVLGPGSDGYHRDHLHFDTARYSGGPYCR